MATLSITIPDANLSAVLNAFSQTFGYSSVIVNPVYDPVNNPGVPQTIPNPVSQAQFAKSCVAKYIKDTYLNYASQQAAMQAQEQQVNAINSINIT